MTEPELDQLAGRVFATPDGKKFLDVWSERSAAGFEFQMQILARLARMRARWRQGGESANDC